MLENPFKQQVPFVVASQPFKVRGISILRNETSLGRKKLSEFAHSPGRDMTIIFNGAKKIDVYIKVAQFRGFPK